MDKVNLNQYRISFMVVPVEPIVVVYWVRTVLQAPCRDSGRQERYHAGGQCLGASPVALDNTVNFLAEQGSQYRCRDSWFLWLPDLPRFCGPGVMTDSPMMRVVAGGAREHESQDKRLSPNQSRGGDG